jgi:hypothetical protein
MIVHCSMDVMFELFFCVERFYLFSMRLYCHYLCDLENALLLVYPMLISSQGLINV